MTIFSLYVGEVYQTGVVAVLTLTHRYNAVRGHTYVCTRYICIVCTRLACTSMACIRTREGIEFSRTKQVVPGMIFYGVEFFSVVSSFRTTASKEKNENRENFQRHRKYTPYILLENTW